MTTTALDLSTAERGPTARGILLRGRAELDDHELIVLLPETIITWGVESHPYQRLTRRLSGAPGA